MPRPVAVLTVEEKAAKYDDIMARKRANNQKYYVENPAVYREYYDANKDKLIQRGAELRREKAAAKRAAKAAPVPDTPDV
jgi:hypothetical protein